jgi:hypothetical protein
VKFVLIAVSRHAQQIYASGLEIDPSLLLAVVSTESQCMPIGYFEHGKITTTWQACQCWHYRIYNRSFTLPLRLLVLWKERVLIHKLLFAFMARLLFR